MPIVLALIMATISAALWLYARNVALNAARQGLAAANDNGASISAGVPAAEAFVRQAAGDLLTSVHATTTVTRGADRTVTVTVTGVALSAIPFWRQSVTQSAMAPLETFTLRGTHH